MNLFVPHLGKGMMQLGRKQEIAFGLAKLIRAQHYDGHVT